MAQDIETFEVEDKDGTIYEVDAPKGTSMEQVLSTAKKAITSWGSFDKSVPKEEQPKVSTGDESNPPNLKPKGVKGLKDMPYDLWKKTVPIEYRWYLQSLLGDRSQPLTEKDMTQEELIKIDNYIKERGVLSPEGSPNTGYIGDNTAYGTEYTTNDDFLTTDANSIENTLGRFVYKDSDNNKRTISDSYEFSNEYLDRLIAEYADKSDWEKVKELISRIPGKLAHQGLKSGVVDAALEAGTAFIGKDGRKVDIKYNTKATKVSTANNPLNLKTKDVTGFREFTTVGEGIKAAVAQLQRYFAGEGIAKGKDIKSVQDVIGMWRPKSDRRGEKDISQKDYEKVVADTIGVSPTDTLDINNKETLSKLIHGISKVEGNEVDLDTILKALGN
tara:strand:+ start:3601 stop:4764 length:1164 start_codon:yes stop_codon:yes gene_type:complete